MKYNKSKITKNIVFVILSASIFTVQAIYVKSNNKSVQEQVPQLVAALKKNEIYIIGRKVQYDQWILQCKNGNVTGNEKCNLIHQIKNKHNQQLIKIEALKTAGSDTILFELPLGVYLPAGAKLIVGESEYVMPITTCSVSGCQAKIKPNLNLKQQLKREGKAIVQLLHINQKQKININISLMGYSKGYKEIK